MTRTLQVLAALLVLGIGIIHVPLGLSREYRSLGTHPVTLGDQFLVQGVLSLVVAALLLRFLQRRVLLLAALFSLGSLVALVLSRTVGVYVPGLPVLFTERWTPISLLTLAVEAGALAACAVLLVRERRA